MGAGEQDALGGQLIQAWAGHVGVAVRAEIAAEVMPVHDQHVVALRDGHVADPISREQTQNALIWADSGLFVSARGVVWRQRTWFPMSCPMERMSTWPLKSSRTLPRPENHSSSSASRSNRPAVSMLQAWILLYGRDV